MFTSPGGSEAHSLNRISSLCVCVCVGFGDSRITKKTASTIKLNTEETFFTHPFYFERIVTSCPEGSMTQRSRCCCLIVSVGGVSHSDGVGVRGGGVADPALRRAGLDG